MGERATRPSVEPGPPVIPVKPRSKPSKAAKPSRSARPARPGRHAPPPAQARRRRVLIADARRNGSYLRTTWHAENGMFVVSTWNDEVCLGAIRVPVEDAAELMSLLMDGLVEAIGSPPRPDAPPAPAPPRTSLGRGWDGFRAQLWAWARTGAGWAAAARRVRLTTEPPPSRPTRAPSPRSGPRRTV